MQDEFGTTEPRQVNTLGLVGLILAFCLSPIGLVISLIALTKTPRGMAIGGVIVGAIGTVIWALVIAGLVAGGAMVGKVVDLFDDYTSISAGLEDQRNQAGEYPEDLSGLMLSEDHAMDPWGTPYRYEKTGPQTYLLTVAGPDRAFGTADDMDLSAGMTQDELGEVFGDSIEDSMKQGRTGAGGTGAGDSAPVEETPATDEDTVPE